MKSQHPESSESRLPLLCDCCGREQVGTLIPHAHGVAVHIRARRHGVWHSLTLEMTALAQVDVTETRVKPRRSGRCDQEVL